MQNMLPEDSFLNTPAMPTSEEEIAVQLGSMQSILQENIGLYVQIEFLLGTQGTVTRLGVLYTVGRNYVVLYDPGNKNYLLCDIFSIKFVTFFSPDGLSGYEFPVQAPQQPRESVSTQTAYQRNRPRR